MSRARCFAILTVLCLTATAVQAEVDLGLNYDSNVYGDALEEGDFYFSANLLKKGRLSPVFRYDLGFSGKKYARESSADTILAALDLGAGFDLTGNATFSFDYFFRNSIWPNYNNDYQDHQLAATYDFDQAAGMRTWLTAFINSARYSEQALSDPSGNFLKEERLDRIIGFEVRQDLGQMGLRLFYSYNDSNGNFYYAGPFGLPQPGVTPVLIDDYYSRSENGLKLEYRLYAQKAELAYLWRDYTSRPAKDSLDLILNEKEKDQQLMIRLSSLLGNAERLALEAGYLRSVSNDWFANFKSYWINLSYKF